MSARAKKRAVAITPALLRRWPLPKPGSDSDKHDRGVALVIGGATDVPGGLLLAGLAALRAGAGKLQLAGPRSIGIALGVAIPEARVIEAGNRLARKIGPVGFLARELLGEIPTLMSSVTRRNG